MNFQKLMLLIIVCLLGFYTWLDFDARKKKRDLLNSANDIMIANVAAVDRLAAKRWFKPWI